jgi:hypothetical protein
LINGEIGKDVRFLVLVHSIRRHHLRQAGPPAEINGHSQGGTKRACTLRERAAAKKGRAVRSSLPWSSPTTG